MFEQCTEQPSCEEVDALNGSLLDLANKERARCPVSLGNRDVVSEKTWSRDWV